MPPSFNELDQVSFQKMMATAGLTQLYRNASMVGVGTTSLGSDDLNKYFSKGQTASIRRIKDAGVAQDYDPRSGTDATTEEIDYVNVNLTLDRLFTKGFPDYSSDANREMYLRDFAESVQGSTRKSIDDYLYDRGFRDWSSLAGSGVENIAAHPPLAIVSSEDGSGGLGSFSKSELINASKVLNRREVPDASRVVRLGVQAHADFLGDAVMVEGFAGAQASSDPGRQLIAQGLNLSRQVQRYGFSVRGSNAITGQDAVADLGDGAAVEPTSAYVQDTTVFFEDDLNTSTPLGAVRITVNQTANLAADVAIGKIARLGPADGSAIAYGIILRVDAANKYVWMVPYSPTGNKLTAAYLTANAAGTNFSVPEIGEVGTANHRQSLLYVSRLLDEPDPGTGAVATRAADPNTGLVMQVFKGSYNIHQFKGGTRHACLFGAKPSDHRKAVLMLSA